jgi:twitching motility two-component system response regulator PilH
MVMVCEVVLIDDDPDFAGSLTEVLEHEGHDVHAFSTPEAAFEWLLSGGRADLVLLDLRTPGMSARRFRALLMSTPMLRDLDVVVVSGAPEANEVATAVGASEVFGKPIDLERLLATVRRHCRTTAHPSAHPRP